MLQFVADFLAGAQRDNDIADFPGFLGKQVALAIESSEPVGALSLVTAAELQRVLEASGRQLLLGAADAYTQTAAAESPDLIYLASYRTAGGETDLLDELGIQLVEEIITPTLSVPAPAALLQTPSPTPVPEQGAADGVALPQTKETPPPPSLPRPEEPALTPAAPPEVPPPLMTPSVSPTPTIPAGGQSTPVTTPVTTRAAAPPAPTNATPDTVSRFDLQQAPITDTVDPALAFPTPAVSLAATVTPTVGAPNATVTPTVTSAPEPQVRLLLDRGDGLRLLADETLLFARRTNGAGSHTLAVLGNSSAAINAAMTRLLSRDFSGCLIQADLVICPYSPGTAAASAPATGSAAAAPTPTASPAIRRGPHARHTCCTAAGRRSHDPGRR